MAQLPKEGWGISHDRYLGNFTRSVTLPATWSIAGPGRATITPDGVVTALGAGQFTVRAVVRDSLFQMEVEAYGWTYTSDASTTKVVLGAFGAEPDGRGGMAYPTLTIACAGGALEVRVQLYTRLPISRGTLLLPAPNAPAVFWLGAPPNGTGYRYAPTAEMTAEALIDILADVRLATFSVGQPFVNYYGTSFEVAGMRQAVAPVLAACR